jgi:hypothetical protein
LINKYIINEIFNFNKMIKELENYYTIEFQTDSLILHSKSDKKIYCIDYKYIDENNVKILDNYELYKEMKSSDINQHN